MLILHMGEGPSKKVPWLVVSVSIGCLFAQPVTHIYRWRILQKVSSFNEKHWTNGTFRGNFQPNSFLFPKFIFIHWKCKWKCDEWSCLPSIFNPVLTQPFFPSIFDECFTESLFFSSRWCFSCFQLSTHFDPTSFFPCDEWFFCRLPAYVVVCHTAVICRP